MSNEQNQVIQLDGYLVDRIIEMYDHPKFHTQGVCNHIDELLDADMYTDRESHQLKEVLAQIKEKQRMEFSDLNADELLLRLLSRQDNIGCYYSIRLNVLKAIYPRGKGVW